MTAAYSLDLRERAMARKAAGETNREIAAALRIAPSCVSKWTKRERETGSLAPGQVGGYKPRTLSGDCAQWLRERIASGPFTLRGLAADLAIVTPGMGVNIVCRSPRSGGQTSMPIHRRCGCSSTPRG
jgi:putative transposase